MPARSVAQQHFFGAELARAKAGKATKTGLAVGKLEEFARTSTKGLPAHTAPVKHHAGGRIPDDHLRQGYSK